MPYLYSINHDFDKQVECLNLHINYITPPLKKQYPINYFILSSNWTPGGLVSLMRNERYCGDVLARKTYTPNFKDHKAKKNCGKKNKYFQADHHEAIVTRAVWNAAQRILNSRRFGHEGSYLPMHIIDKGVLAGFISMNRSWASFDTEDYYRA